MMTFGFERAGGSGVLAFEGELTVKHGNEVREALIRALAEADDVVVNVESVRNVDTSCLQLFCSACRTAERLKKRINFSGKLPDCVKRAMKVVGYDQRTGCGFDFDSRCIWLPR